MAVATLQWSEAEFELHQLPDAVMVVKDGERLIFPFHWAHDDARGWTYASVTGARPRWERLMDGQWQDAGEIDPITFQSWVTRLDALLD